MSDIAIKVENLSKLYQLGEVGTGTISHDLNRWWASMRGKEDPYAKIGQANDRTRKADSNFVWALKDINFEVKQGEVLGIIGRNGAGKSTLLKILSKITTPSTGKIYTKGRIASLLEVGTGFHPEMTGRENIYLNGAILGMRKWEIDKKFDEIVDFAGVEAYVDTPVKRYSSGMYVRLAFAVAAFLEPEILIIDEVLAVGDAEFQRKCLGRMKDVSVNEGRTVLFVSHNMIAIKNLCNSCLGLENGLIKVDKTDRIEDAVSKYLQKSHNQIEWISNKDCKNSNIYIKKVKIKVYGDQPHLKLQVETLIFFKESIPDSSFLAFYISDINSVPIMEAIPSYNLIQRNEITGLLNIKVEISINNFIPGVYFLGIWLGQNHLTTLDWLKEIISFEIIDSPEKGRTIPYPPHAGFLSNKPVLIGIEYHDFI